jgi:hypothetical protein
MNSGINQRRARAFGLCLLALGLTACGSDERFGNAADASADGVGESDAGDCALPADGTLSALCLRFDPEPIDFEKDSRHDGKGVLIVQLFDTPIPEAVDGGPRAPFAEQRYPEQADAGAGVEANVTALPLQRFDGLPKTVYVRSIFSDDPATLPPRFLGSGVWLGGYDPNGGLRPEVPLAEVTLTPGVATVRTVRLRVMRSIKIGLQLDSAVKPLDDGQGPAIAVMFRNSTLGLDNPPLGFASSRCAVLPAGGQAVISGFLLGSGEYYVLGMLNDLNLASRFAQPIAGSLLSTTSLDPTPPPLVDKLTVGERQYSAEGQVVLRQVVPVLGADAGVGYACPSGDGGAR